MWYLFKDFNFNIVLCYTYKIQVLNLELQIQGGIPYNEEDQYK